MWAAVLILPLHLPCRLKELTICSCGFTALELPELPEALKVLRIMCMNFNQKLKLLVNQEELVIRSVNFNQQMRLPERLKSLRIYSATSGGRSSGRLPTCGDLSRGPERLGLACNYPYIGSTLFSKKIGTDAARQRLLYGTSTDT